MNMTLAIDFGNSRTKAAYFDIKKAQPVTLQLSTEQPLPSLFYVGKNGNIKIGDEVLDATKSDPEGEVHLGLKEDLTDKYLRVDDRGKKSVVELLTALFKRIRERASEVPSFHGDLCNKVCLTTTNIGWNREMVKVLKSAAANAGFPLEGINVLPEAEAAARAAGSVRLDPEFRDMIVLDCGDFTLDWAYVERGENGKFDLSKKEDVEFGGNKVGGRNVDMGLLNLLEEKKQLPSCAPPDPIQRYEIRKLFKEPYCRSPEEYEIPVKECIGGYDVELTGDEIQSVITDDYIKRVCCTVKDFITDVEKATGGKKETPILLVGGSSRLRGLKNTLNKTFEHEILLWDIAEYATVYGAVPIPDPNELYEEGNRYLETEAYPQALTYFACAIKLDRNHEGAHAAIVRAYLRRDPDNLEAGGYDTMIADFQRDTNIDPTENTPIHFAEAFLELSRLDAAEQVAEKARGLNSAAESIQRVLGEITSAFFDRGRKCLRQGDAEAAITDLEKVIERDEKNVDASVYLAEAFLELGRLDAAEQVAEKARGLNSAAESIQRVLGEITSAFFDRGRKCLRHGDAEAAITDLEKVIERDEKNVDAYVYLAEACIVCEQIPTAEKNIKAALKRERNYPFALSVLKKITVKDYAQGITSLAAGSYKEAASYFKAVTTIDGRDVDAYIHLAEAYLGQYLSGKENSGETPNQKLMKDAKKAIGKAEEYLLQKYTPERKSRNLQSVKRAQKEDPDYPRVKRVSEIIEIELKNSPRENKRGSRRRKHS